MKRQAYSLLFALLVVLASVSLRKGFANAESSVTWNNSSTQISQSVILSSHPLAIGASPMPLPPYRSQVASIGASPMPLPPYRSQVASIGASPMPLPPYRHITA